MFIIQAITREKGSSLKSRGKFNPCMLLAQTVTDDAHNLIHRFTQITVAHGQFLLLTSFLSLLA